MTNEASSRKNKRTRMIVVAAPSGAGKSSFVDKITSEIPKLHDLITHTTRSMREGEVQGKPYHFINRQEFEEKIKEDYFIEWAQVHTNLYGTSYEELNRAWDQGKVVIMDIDIQGVSTFKTKFPEDVKTVFILPPSIDELRRRVMKRDGGKTADLEVRMKNAAIEMAKAAEFDVQIINDDFDRSYAEFKKIITEWLGDGFSSIS